MPNAEVWYVYLLQCSDGTFYTGVTTDLTRRVEEHNGSTIGAKYTRARRPVHLVYSEEASSRSSACVREAQIRSLPRSKKLELASV